MVETGLAAARHGGQDLGQRWLHQHVGDRISCWLDEYRGFV